MPPSRFQPPKSVREAYRVFAAALLGLVSGNLPAAESAPLEYTVKLETVMKHDDGQFLWFHPRVAAIPCPGQPQPAVVMRDGFAHVLVLGDQNRVRLTKVDTGRLVNGQIEITRGLDANARVAVQGAAFLNDGDVVRVVPDSEQNQPVGRASKAQTATK